MSANIDLRDIQKELSSSKVYDECPYVESLKEYISYMYITYELINKTYQNRLQNLRSKSQRIIREAFNKGKSEITEEDLNCTNALVVGIGLDDTLFIRKSTLEFFHYARVSIDIVFQIINSALFGNESVDINDRNLIREVSNRLAKEKCFSPLHELLEDNKKNPTFKYVQAFDNYNKHIKTIIVKVKSSFIFGYNNEFSISQFTYNKEVYEETNALDKLRDVNSYVIKTVNNILLEVKKQIPKGKADEEKSIEKN